MNRVADIGSLPTLAATRRQKKGKRPRPTPEMYAARVLRICREEWCMAVVIPDSDFGVRTVYGPGHSFDRIRTHHKQIIGLYTEAADPQQMADDIRPYWTKA